MKNTKPFLLFAVFIAGLITLFALPKDLSLSALAASPYSPYGGDDGDSGDADPVTGGVWAVYTCDAPGIVTLDSHAQKEGVPLQVAASPNGPWTTLSSYQVNLEALSAQFGVPAEDLWFWTEGKPAKLSSMLTDRAAWMAANCQ